MVDWRNRWPCKYFSVFIQAGGSYRLTPFYDIISAFPVLGGTGIHISDLKLAMGLNASKGKKTAIDKIYPRHFLATAKVLKFPEVQMHEILSDFARMIPAALDNVKTPLVYVGAHNVYYVKLPVKVLYFTIHIHTQINQYVVISDFPPVSVEKFNLCSVMAHHRP